MISILEISTYNAKNLINQSINQASIPYVGHLQPLKLYSIVLQKNV